MSTLFGTGTMICARNAAIDESQPHVATKWVTLLYFRLWPLATYRLQMVGSSLSGVPLVFAVMGSNYQILEQLPWTENKKHIITSLLVGWAVVASPLWLFLIELIRRAGWLF